MAQQTYSTLFDGFASDAEAKASFGVPDGRSCDVYVLDMDREGFALLAEHHNTDWFSIANLRSCAMERAANRREAQR